MSCRATQDGRVMGESSDKTLLTGEGNDKPVLYSWLKKPMNSMKRQKDMPPEDEPHREVSVQYATEEEWRKSFRKKGEPGPVQKCHSAVNVSGGESKIQCCKEQSCIGT